MCNQWLALDEYDGKTDRHLHAASCALPSDPSTLLQNNVNRKLFDDHLWLSVGYRKNKSDFTRVQRLSCCLAVLFLAMISNAMWYKTEGDTPTQSGFTIGPISFTVHELYTSFMSSLILVPPVLLITTLFSRAAPPKQSSDRAGHDESVTQRKNMNLTIQTGDDESVAQRKNMNLTVQTGDDASVAQRKNMNLSMPPGDGDSVTQRRKKRGCSGELPHWCVYVAWFLVVLAVLASAFFTVLYSFQWGGETSKAWLVTFLLSFIQSVVLMQPIQVNGSEYLRTDPQ